MVVEYLSTDELFQKIINCSVINIRKNFIPQLPIIIKIKKINLSEERVTLGPFTMNIKKLNIDNIVYSPTKTNEKLQNVVTSFLPHSHAQQ